MDQIQSLVELAKQAIREYVLNNNIIEPPPTLTPEMSNKSGVFVSLKKGGRLRGCIGTYLPTTDNVAQEIIMNAISAATRDPRFKPVQPSELNEIEYSVDILAFPEPAMDINHLDPKKYGIIVVEGNKRGLLLPNIEGVDTVDMQIQIACGKAQIDPGSKFDIFRFEVKRYKK